MGLRARLEVFIIVAFLPLVALVASLFVQQRNADIDHATRIIAALSTPMALDGQDIRIGCSVGMALWPVDDTDFDTVLRYADQALYTAKRNGRGQVGVHGAAVPAGGGAP